MGNIESVDGQSEMKHHIMPLKVPMPDPTELEEKFAVVLVSRRSLHIFCHGVRGLNVTKIKKKKRKKRKPFQIGSFLSLTSVISFKILFQSFKSGGINIRNNGLQEKTFALLFYNFHYSECVSSIMSC